MLYYIVSHYMRGSFATCGFRFFIRSFGVEGSGQNSPHGKGSLTSQHPSTPPPGLRTTRRGGKKQGEGGRREGGREGGERGASFWL